MGDKAGVISLVLDKSDLSFHFWMGVVKGVVGPESIQESSSVVIVNVPFKGYDLSDEQFVQLKLGLQGEVRSLLIPRNLINLIVEGENLDKGLFDFAGDAKK